MDFVTELVTVLGSTAIVVAAVAWVARSVLTHFLSKDLDKHKATLSAQHALEMEKLRADLTRQSIEHQIRYRRVDDKVAKHLAEIYRRLLRLYECVHSYVRILEASGDPSKEEKLEAATKANAEFWDYFLNNRIYVAPSLYQLIRQVAEKLANITNDFTSDRRREEKGLLREDEVGYWSKAFNAVDKEASQLFSALVRIIQKRLGVEDDAETLGCQIDECQRAAGAPPVGE